MWWISLYLDKKNFRNTLSVSLSISLSLSLSFPIFPIFSLTFQENIKIKKDTK